MTFLLATEAFDHFITYPPAREPRVVLVGVPLHRLSRSHQLPCLAVLVLVSSILAAALQERVLYVPGFRYTGAVKFSLKVPLWCCMWNPLGNSDRNESKRSE